MVPQSRHEGAAASFPRLPRRKDFVGQADTAPNRAARRRLEELAIPS